jgi:hypothetical protein
MYSQYTNNMIIKKEKNILEKWKSISKFLSAESHLAIGKDHEEKQWWWKRKLGVTE